ncbi:MAG: tetratricopeptide repeat protein [Nitrospirae bacterium]|nr:tetratricopeptide repeat protein [Nitrospirota bacterium]
MSGVRVMSGIVLLAAVTVTACGGPEERKAKYFAKANEYIDAANYPKARVALRNVLKIDPKDAEAYYLFAQVEEKEKNWRNAVQLYQEAVRLVPDHAAALITLAKYYLEARLTERRHWRKSFQQNQMLPSYSRHCTANNGAIERRRRR